MKNEQYEAIVVGGGVGGLSTALSLSRNGHKVLLLEKNESPGGNCSSRKMDEYTFDLAVHQLTGVEGDGQCGVVLKDLGIRHKLDFARVDPFLVLDMPDRSYTLPGSWDGVRSSLVKAFPKEEASIDRFLAKMRAIKQDAMMAQRILYGANSVVDELLNKDVPLSRWLSFPQGMLSMLAEGELTAEKFFRRYIKDDKLMSVVCGAWPYLGVPPSQLSGMMMAFLFGGQHMEKTFYPIGSSQRIADVFVESIEEHGGTVRLGAEVKRILVKDGRAYGVELANGEQIHCRFVVCNAPAAYAYRELIDPKEVPKRLLRKLGKMEKSVGPFKVYLGLDYDVSKHGLDHHEYLIYDSYDHEENYRRMQEGYPSSLSAYSPTKADPSLAPEGHSTLILTTMFPWQTKRDWRNHVDEIAEEMITKMEKRLPDIRQHIKTKRTLTPEKLKAYTNTTDGSMYGWANSVSQVLIKRLSNRSPIRDLYLVGHWTQPGTGVTTCIISGWMIGNLLQKTYGNVPSMHSILRTAQDALHSGFRGLQ